MSAPDITPIASRAHRSRGRARRRAFRPMLCRPAIVLACLLLGAASAQCEEAVLLTATAPGFVPGMVITTTQHLVVPEAASVTLLFRSGQMLHLKGPFDGSLAQAQSAGEERPPSVLAEMLRLRGVDAGVIGATRSTSLVRPQAVPHDVLVDPQRSATYCLQPADSVWIAVSGHSGRLTGGIYHVRRRGSDRSVAWSSDESRVPWPDDLPIEDGDRFAIVKDGAEAAVAFRRFRGPFRSDAGWIAAGLLRGCAAQFDGMLDRLIQDSVTPELWLTSEHGRIAHHRRGEPIRLTAQSNVDGYLYCGVESGDGTVEPMPTNGMHVRAALPVALASPRGVQIASPGRMRVHCWLSRRDLADKVPAALLMPAGQPISRQDAAALDLLFNHVADAQVARASLDIPVD